MRYCKLAVFDIYHGKTVSSSRQEATLINTTNAVCIGFPAIYDHR